MKRSGSRGRWGVVAVVVLAACAEGASSETASGPGGASDGGTSTGAATTATTGAGSGASTGSGSGSGGGAGSSTGSGGGEVVTNGPTDHVSAVWVVNDGEKVEEDDLAHPAKAGNSAWDGSVAKVFGGRNEVVALQVMVEAGPAGIAGLEASLPSLVRRGGGGTITYAPPGADPTEYVGRPIQIFTEHYMHVDDPTNAHWLAGLGSAAEPDDMLGDKPVQLVPENAKPGMGGLPIAVEAAKNQAIWIDVYLDRDLAPGTYDGTIRIETDGELRKVPLEVEVMDFTLPDQNSLDVMLYYETEQVTQYQGKDLDAQYHRFAHRNRVELVNAYDEAAVTASLGRFDGSDFTAAAGYAGPGDGVGNRLVPRAFYEPGDLFLEQASAWQESDAWMTFLASAVPDARTFVYMVDEPGSGDYPGILDIADNVHSNPGPGKDLPIFVTHGYTSQLGDAIDIWCAGAPHFDKERAETERAQGDDMWFYNGSRPYTGAMLIDSPATDGRMLGWASFSGGTPVYFFWMVNHWYHNSHSPPGYDRNQNVWASPMTFINQDGEFGNGDGVLVYPGTEAVHPAEDRGIEGPVSTVQLANLRRGVQDHLYLTMAKACGQDALVDASLEAIVPHVFTDANAAVSFPEHGDAYEKARRDLAEALAACP